MVRVYRLRAGFYISGHAGFAPKGRDIVCAGVSALAFATHSALKARGCRVQTAGCEDEGTLCVIAKGETHDFDAVMTVFDEGIKALEATYPRHIRFCRGGKGGLQDAF